MKYGLKDSTVEQIRSVLGHHPEVEEAILYGSRAKGNFKDGSDIDLTLRGVNLALRELNAIELELDDLLLPYEIDLSIYDQIENSELLDHIRRVGKVFYSRKAKIRTK